jgi:hypothetical protein
MPGLRRVLIPRTKLGRCLSTGNHPHLTTSIRGFRSRHVTLVTPLLDPELYPAEELVGLYARRWRLELCLRDLKTTMGIEVLRCKTPDMAEKELLAYLVAHI